MIAACNCCGAVPTGTNRVKHAQHPMQGALYLLVSLPACDASRMERGSGCMYRPNGAAAVLEVTRGAMAPGALRSAVLLLILEA
jgi:hypothetical protein